MVGVVWTVLCAVVWLVVRVAGLVGRGLAWLGRVCGFVVEPLVELVSARLGTAPVAPRLRRWTRLVAQEWRAYRAGAVEGEVMEGVWR